MSDYFFSNATDLKLIILFIAENFKRPVSISDITDIILGKDYGEYFNVAQSFAELEESAFIIPAVTKGQYIITKKGHDAYDLFASQIPYTVKRDLLKSISSARISEAEARSVTAEYTLNRASQYDLYCEICEMGFPVFTLSLTLPTLESAKKASVQFKKNAQKIYSEIIDTLT